jgi:SAM-dependent methyltransferase
VGRRRATDPSLRAASSIEPLARIDYERAAATFDRGRSYPLDVFDEWRVALAELLPADGADPVLDVGAGTGIWSAAIARWFSTRVVAVEPSSAMLAEARTKRLPATVTLVAGAGEAIPFRQDACRAAWLSTVIHHLADLGACATELRRVLRPGGRVLIRSSFPGRQDEIPLFDFFPGARRVAETFPTVEQTERAFAAAGFAIVDLRRVHESRGADPDGLVARVAAMRTSDSTLVGLSDEEFADGMAALEQHVAEGQPIPPAGLDLLVFG